MMNKTDFSSDANPWLERLEDDPDRDHPSSTIKTTTIPGGSIEIEGELSTLDDGEITSQYQTQVDQDDVDTARSVRPMTGLDILAFYKSFRFIDRHPFPGNWGVFILDAGLEGLAQDLAVFKPNLPLEELRSFSQRILLAHEYYHFWIDAWALGQEIAPFIKKYKRYEYYLGEKQEIELTHNDFEESLANHYAYIKLKDHRFSDKSVVGPTLRELLKDSPIPYSDCFYNRQKQVVKESWLAIAVANGRSVGFSKLCSPEEPLVISASIQPIDQNHPVSGSDRCPTYFVKTSGYAGLIQPLQGPSLKEFKNFITKYLAGEKSRRTDHSFFRIDNGEEVKFPNPHDKNVRGYELKSVISKAGMTMSEFNSARIETNRWKNSCPRSESKHKLLNQPFPR